MKYPVIILHPGREQSLLRRHQWVFSGAIKKKDKSLADGDIVSVSDSKGNILGTGHYQDSSIAVRILAFEDVTIETLFWQKKLQAACDYRIALGLIPYHDTNAFRLVHGEGDALPGLIIDIYDRIAVLQAHSTGMYLQRHEIAHALMQLRGLTLQGVADKSADLIESIAATDTDRTLAGHIEETVRIAEHGITFLVDIVHGQKTGFFLDQRANRQLVHSHSAGKEVLNCFCYTGGFSLYALAGKANRVTSIDSSSAAIELLEKNILANHFIGHHHAICADVMQHLKSSNEDYDQIICDPPAFAKSMHKRHNAVQAYKRLNVMAMQRLRPGGMLFTFSCSQVVDRQLFHDTIVAAAIESGRQIRVISELQQSPDHPVSIYHPESRYLKGLVLYLA